MRVVVLASLLVACGSEPSEGRAYLTFYDAGNEALTHLASTPEDGFHFASADEWAPVGDPTRLSQEEVIDVPGLTTFEPSSGRFSGSAIRTSRFSGSLTGGSFSGSTTRSSGFSGSAAPAAAFSGRLSSGAAGSCSLAPICEFLELICELSGDGECLSEAATCRADLASVTLTADFGPVACAIADYIECVTDELRARGIEGFVTVDPDTLCVDFLRRIEGG
ncbi:MAG: hypothetical protein AAFX94_16415 [Myxococcota bacterium]